MKVRKSQGSGIDNSELQKRLDLMEGAVTSLSSKVGSLSNQLSEKEQANILIGTHSSFDTSISHPNSFLYSSEHGSPRERTETAERTGIEESNKRT